MGWDRHGEHPGYEAREAGKVGAFLNALDSYMHTTRDGRKIDVRTIDSSYAYNLYQFSKRVEANYRQKGYLVNIEDKLMIKVLKEKME